MEGRNDGFYDAMAITSFLLGMANYNENVTQSSLQETAKGIIKDIHNHLQQQDDKIDYINHKIDYIIKILEGSDKE